ncbi:ABC transporter substrate-binding protein [Streptomyces nogalater]
MLALGGGAAAYLTLGRGPGGGPPVHTLGFQADLSGADQADGVAQERGARLAVARHNARAGIAFRLALDTFDDRGDATGARRAAEHFTEAAVRAVLGPNTLPAALAAAPRYQAERTAMVLVSLDDPRLDDDDTLRTLRVTRSPEQFLAVALIAYLTAVRPVDRTAVIDDRAAGRVGSDLVDSLTERPPGEGTTRVYPVPAGSDDFSPPSVPRSPAGPRPSSSPGHRRGARRAAPAPSRRPVSPGRASAPGTSCARPSSGRPVRRPRAGCSAPRSPIPAACPAPSGPPTARPTAPRPAAGLRRRTTRWDWSRGPWSRWATRPASPPGRSPSGCRTSRTRGSPSPSASPPTAPEHRHTARRGVLPLSDGRKRLPVPRAVRPDHRTRLKNGVQPCARLVSLLIDHTVVASTRRPSSAPYARPSPPPPSSVPSSRAPPPAERWSSSPPARSSTRPSTSSARRRRSPSSWTWTPTPPP